MKKRMPELRLYSRGPIRDSSVLPAQLSTRLYSLCLQQPKSHSALISFHWCMQE
jgi:hypothetical protein